MNDDTTQRIAASMARLDAIEARYKREVLDILRRVFRYMLYNHKDNTLMIESGIRMIDALNKDIDPCPTPTSETSGAPSVDAATQPPLTTRKDAQSVGASSISSSEARDGRKEPSLP